MQRLCGDSGEQVWQVLREFEWGNEELRHWSAWAIKAVVPALLWDPPEHKFCLWSPTPRDMWLGSDWATHHTYIQIPKDEGHSIQLWCLSFFNIFFAYYFGREKLRPSLQRKNSKKNHGRAIRKEFGITREELFGRAPSEGNSWPECRLKLHFFYLLFFIIRTVN